MCIGGAGMQLADTYANYYFGLECGFKLNYQFVSKDLSALYNIFRRSYGTFHVSFEFDPIHKYEEEKK